MNKIIGLSFLVAMLSITACQSTTAANVETTSTAELRNTLWKLTSLNGKAVETAEGRRMASLTLSTDESLARIATACNSGSAAFSLNGNAIKFSASMSTKMGCEPGPMEQEREFFKVIADTTRFAIKGETLELYDAGNKLLASFHSEYLK
jgi:heat shock protein HslJ